MKISFIGVGHMGGAMLRGVIAAGVATPSEVAVCDASDGRATALAMELGVRAATNVAEAAAGADVVFLAVRPADMQGVLESLKGVDALLISIAAGKRTDWIEAQLEAGARVVRVMPNLAVSVGEGMCAYTGGRATTPSDLDTARKILSAFGKAIELEEKHFDAVTALSGSGPAFFAAFLDSMRIAGQALGLADADAAMLALQTMLGTAKVLSQPGAPTPAQFVAAVATKGGTTAAGMRQMESSDLGDVCARTLAAAATRSKELSNP